MRYTKLAALVMSIKMSARAALAGAIESVIEYEEYGGFKLGWAYVGCCEDGVKRNPPFQHY
jgi:hypothetical protein